MDKRTYTPNKRKVEPLTDAQIRERFGYDPETGEIISRTLNRKVGSISEMGYERINCGSRTIMTHRLAWLLYYGEWPAELVDHIDRNKTNNRIKNLRLTTRRDNALNTDQYDSARLISKQSSKSTWIFSYRSARLEISSFAAQNFCDAVKLRKAVKSGEPLPDPPEPIRVNKKWMIDHTGVMAIRGRPNPFNPIRLRHIAYRPERGSWILVPPKGFEASASFNTAHFCDILKVKRALDIGRGLPAKREEPQRPDRWLENHTGVMERRGSSRSWSRLRLSHINMEKTWSICDDTAGRPKFSINRRHFCELLKARRAQDRGDPIPPAISGHRGKLWVKNHTGIMVRRGYVRPWQKLPTARIFRQRHWTVEAQRNPKTLVHRQTFCEVLKVARALQNHQPVPPAITRPKRPNKWLQHHTGLMARRGGIGPKGETERQNLWQQLDLFR